MIEFWHPEPSLSGHLCRKGGRQSLWHGHWSVPIDFDCSLVSLSDRGDGSRLSLRFSIGQTEMLSDSASVCTDDIIPRLDPGLVALERPSSRSTALHQLVVSHMCQTDGRILWVDARNNASTYVLSDLAPSTCAISNLRVARAFTAYQHHSLIGDLLAELSATTSLLVVPCVASLYEDDDVHDSEARGLLEATLTTLAEIASVFEIPVLVSTAGSDDLDDLVVEYTTDTIACELTDHGYHYETDEFETLVYRNDGYWQTTIPYWVDRFGAVDEIVPALDPVASEPRQLALAGV